ncbi:hypothetical protein [Niallia oryzisoli]|uniref:hypothetical protein n=1 Tax=Niallia oryzisoli TaxID=1737571 RepID=UPI0037364BE8
MSDQNYLTLSDAFDYDFGQPNDTMDDTFHEANDSSLSNYHGISSYDGANDFMDFQDPLKHAYKHQFQPLTLELDNTHFVKPHEVSGYIRADGTSVEPYYRDGDGNTMIDRTVEQGGGYFRSNPDGDPFNNLR